MKCDRKNILNETEKERNEKMILADKIIMLRKKNGWSQEELADKLQVTRQSVSKWEGAQSVPDLERILQMSQIFGVSTDYLLKDDLEEVEYAQGNEETTLRQVSMEEADEFLKIKFWSAKKIAFATMLCILSPVCLMVLGIGAEMGVIPMTEDMGGALGMVILLLLVSIAVGIYIYCGSKTSAYEFLETEEIQTGYGVVGMVNERKKQYHDTYVKGNIVGTCLCIFAAASIFVCAMFEENAYVMIFMIPVLLLLVALGVVCFITVGIPWASFEKLLQEGDYSKEVKENKRYNTPISVIYWLIVTAIFLGYNYNTNDWKSAGIIWPVAGVLYAALMTGISAFRKKSKNVE